MLRSRSLLAFSLVAGFVGTPAHAGELNEDAFIAAWLHESREVSALRTQVGAARFDVITATAWPNPNLQVASSTVISGRNDPPGPIYNWGPQLTFPLPILGQIGARRTAALRALDAADMNVLSTLWDRASDIKDQMVVRAFAAARVSEIERNLGELSQIADVVQTRAAAGANSRYDVLRVATTEGTFRAGLVSATVERNQAEARLVALLAVPRLTTAPIDRTGLAPFHGPLEEGALVSLALERRPDLELARRQAMASDATVERLHRENVPTPSVSVGTYHTYDTPSVSFQAALSFTLPVFDLNRGPIGRARMEASGNRAQAEALETRIRAEVQGAWRARTLAAKALEDFRRLGLANSEELLERATVSYKAGAFAILDLLDAYRAVWDARDQELDLERAFAQAEADLERAAALVRPLLADGASSTP